MKPLRIIHSEAATGFGGQEHRIFKEMRAMRDHGHHLEAICQPGAMMTPRLRDEGFTVHDVPMAGTANFYKGILSIRRILKQGQYDVLNTHSRRDTLIAGIAGRLAGTPLIVRTRHLARRPNSLLSYTIVPHRVTTVSNYVRQGLLDKGVNPEHVAVVYSPVEVPSETTPSTLRHELGLSDDDIIVGCVAVMRRPKGYNDLVDALEPILKKYPNVHAVFVGGGSPVFEEVTTHIANKNLGDRIHMLGRRTDVPNLLKTFNIFALATHHEASGTVFVEAAAAGLPVVGTDVGGVSEMFEDEVSGLLVPVKNPAAMTKALERLIDSPDLRHRMGQAGLQAYQTTGQFSLDALVHNTESCYHRWLTELKS